MIPCICINDKDRPAEIPESKWVKEGQTYHVTYSTIVLPQRMLAFLLYEIDLDESCHPYEYFLSHRFAFLSEHLKDLYELIENCKDTDFSIEELMAQTELVEK